jgi:hypothetical protein
VKSVRPRRIGAGAEREKPRLDGGGAGVGLSAEVETQGHDCQSGKRSVEFSSTSVKSA